MSFYRFWSLSKETFFYFFACTFFTFYPFTLLLGIESPSDSFFIQYIVIVLVLCYVFVFPLLLKNRRMADQVVDFIYKRRIKSTDIKDKITILYLRSFLLDELMLAGRLDEFDKTLKNEVDRYSHFLALGENNRFGIRMRSTSDEQWFDEFKFVADNCDVIVICPFATRSTQRELKHLLQHDRLVKKMLVYTPRKKYHFEIYTVIHIFWDIIRSIYFYSFITRKELPKGFPKPGLLYFGYAQKVWNYSSHILKDRIRLPDYTDEGLLSSYKKEDELFVPMNTFSIDGDGIIKALLDYVPEDKMELKKDMLDALEPDIVSPPPPSSALSSESSGFGIFQGASVFGLGSVSQSDDGKGPSDDSHSGDSSASAE
jgi:hypothetical protein